ncbi:MAG: hypothetical protein LBJ59_04155 [Zoogloeaceae bacterium]|nr:hypothetical protein [Zoogloeaceae bacterium]
MVGSLITLFIVPIAYTYCMNYARESTSESVATFHDQIQVGAVFDRDLFERQVLDKGGRIRNFDNPSKGMEAVGVTDALWDRRALRPIEVAVTATGSAERYDMWLRAPDGWRTAWGGITLAPVNYAFEVENGKVAGISAMRRGEYIQQKNGRWVRRGAAGNEEPIIRGSAPVNAAPVNVAPVDAAIHKQSEEDARQSAEAFYATLEVGAPFNRADFEWQIRAMGGRVQNIQSAAQWSQSQSLSSKELAESGACVQVGILEEENRTLYYTAFFTPNPPDAGRYGAFALYGFSVENGKITRKAVAQNGAWVEIR